jgi:hypothetical protein
MDNQILKEGLGIRVTDKVTAMLCSKSYLTDKNLVMTGNFGFHYARLLVPSFEVHDTSSNQKLNL